MPFTSPRPAGATHPLFLEATLHRCLTPILATTCLSLVPGLPLRAVDRPSAGAPVHEAPVQEAPVFHTVSAWKLLGAYKDMLSGWLGADASTRGETSLPSPSGPFPDGRLTGLRHGHDAGALKGALGLLGGAVLRGESISHAHWRYASRRLVPGPGAPVQVPAVFSGSVFLPPPAGASRSVPILLWCHATELERSDVASAYKAGSTDPRGRETSVAMLAPFAGFLTVVPDYPGLGVDAGAQHPFCHAESLAVACLDMVRDVAGRMPAGYTWNGQLFISGYSEGGYAAMSCLRMLETDPGAYPELRASAAACMAAPFSLSGTMRQLMLDPYRDTSLPFLLPYLLLGYNQVYGDPEMEVERALCPKLLEPRNGETLRTVLDGRAGHERADAWIAEHACTRLSGLGGPVFRRMVREDWVARQIAPDPQVEASSVVLERLRENDLVPARPEEEGWVPRAPVLLVHGRYDESVPFENSLRAYERFSAHGCRVGFIVYDTQGDAILAHKRLAHGMAFLPASLEALFWLKGQVRQEGEARWNRGAQGRQSRP